MVKRNRFLMSESYIVVSCITSPSDDSWGRPPSEDSLIVTAFVSKWQLKATPINVRRINVAHLLGCVQEKNGSH
jgi:hypothetical protein